MTTEQKIREAFEKPVEGKMQKEWHTLDCFKAGYLALLNELEPFVQYKGCKPVYSLPEGVTKP